MALEEEESMLRVGPHNFFDEPGGKAFQLEERAQELDNGVIIKDSSNFSMG